MLKGQVVQNKKMIVNFFAWISVCPLCSIFQVNQDTTCDIKYLLHNLWFAIYWFTIYWMYRDVTCIEWMIKLLTILQGTIFSPMNTRGTLMLMIILLDTLYQKQKSTQIHIFWMIHWKYLQFFFCWESIFYFFYPSEHVWYLCSSL